MKKLSAFIFKHFFVSQLLLCILTGFVWAVISLTADMLTANYQVSVSDQFGDLIPLTVVLTILAFPFILTIFEVILLIFSAKTDEHTDMHISLKKCAIYDCLAIFIGVLMEASLLSLYNVMFDAPWDKELVNMQLHAPINTDHTVTFAVLCSLYLFGMLILAFSSQNKRPPLVTVLCIAMMYLGTAESVLFTIHILGMNYINGYGNVESAFQPVMLFLLFVPLNTIIILIRTMLIQIKSYSPDENRMSKIDSIPFLSSCNKMLQNSKKWPIAALIMMIPLLGIVTVILVLFGQAPDAAIKAYTETANYTFSTKIPPQNVFIDEHYLCTVAAGGHKKVVKPLRMGKRHGHDVVVNRQLLIANAFEQVLEERTPRFHRAVRNFYDTYGFPVAKLIKSKIVADIIFFMMKPLEWLFLLVLYLFDVHPEDRIASQYL